LMQPMPQFSEFEIADFNGCEDAAIRMCEEIIRICDDAIAFDPLKKPVLCLPAPAEPELPLKTEGPNESVDEIRWLVPPKQVYRRYRKPKGL